ncbi:beta-lactamase family protein [Wenzhouxiangella sp. XN201]|uniref:serine hydrolase domain-containing protein n=1 Tax=Wenzhouxiangella sp. XN201 TaxID=2710755 RepID=UPI0013CADE2F|nr:serine hydrolase domain-containing protein [Wenzhouxiangella sp. XN201]NEZ03585.1 beta-lactamase family protein [Wenzhouxiangella sp. XN201]
MERQRAVEKELLPAVDFPDRDKQGWSLARRMTRYKVPGIGMAVVRDGRIDWVAGYGTHGVVSPEPVTASTIFQAASISKMVAAAGMLSLVKKGVLELDGDVNARLSSWKVPNNEFTSGSPVTLRRLLSHSAGVTVHGFPGYAHTEALPSLVQLLTGTEPANSPVVTVDQVPGAGYRYSGGGYEIAELLVEDVTQRPFEQVLDETVLAPLGMLHSTFVQPLPAEKADSAARGHRFDGSQVAGGWYVYPEQAAAGLWSTPTDLARFVVELIAAFHGESERLIDRSMARAMLTRQVGNMGLGAGVHGEGDGLHFDHAGWSQGFRTYLVAYPHSRDGVVVMTNSDGGHELIREILRSVAAVYDWPDFRMEEVSIARLAADRLDRFSGSYEFSGAGFSVALRRERDHLVLDTPRGSRYTFYPESETRFVALENGSRMTLVQAPDGSMSMQLWGMSGHRPEL